MNRRRVHHPQVTSTWAFLTHVEFLEERVPRRPACGHKQIRIKRSPKWGNIREKLGNRFDGHTPARRAPSLRKPTAVGRAIAMIRLVRRLVTSSEACQRRGENTRLRKQSSLLDPGVSSGATLLFRPNEQHEGWRLSLGAEPLAELMRRMADGQWDLPAGWRERIKAEFDSPNPLVLRARVAGSTLVLTPEPPLQPKNSPAGRVVEFQGPPTDAQRELVRLLASGLTIRAAARRMGYSTRWAQYQLHKRASKTPRSRRRPEG